MLCSLTELRNKEVVNICNGQKLGYVDDFEIDTERAIIAALVVFGRERFFGLFGREDDIIIPYEKINLVGEDIILVNV